MLILMMWTNVGYVGEQQRQKKIMVCVNIDSMGEY